MQKNSDNTTTNYALPFLLPSVVFDRNIIIGALKYHDKMISNFLLETS